MKAFCSHKAIGFETIAGMEKTLYRTVDSERCVSGGQDFNFEGSEESSGFLKRLMWSVFYKT